MKTALFFLVVLVSCQNAMSSTGQRSTDLRNNVGDGKFTGRLPSTLFSTPNTRKDRKGEIKTVPFHTYQGTFSERKRDLTNTDLFLKSDSEARRENKHNDLEEKVSSAVEKEDAASGENLESKEILNDEKPSSNNLLILKENEQQKLEKVLEKDTKINKNWGHIKPMPMPRLPVIEKSKLGVEDKSDKEKIAENDMSHIIPMPMPRVPVLESYLEKQKLAEKEKEGTLESVESTDDMESKKDKTEIKSLLSKLESDIHQIEKAEDVSLKGKTNIDDKQLEDVEHRQQESDVAVALPEGPVKTNIYKSRLREILNRALEEKEGKKNQPNLKSIKNLNERKPENLLDFLLPQMLGSSEERFLSQRHPKLSRNMGEASLSHPRVNKEEKLSLSDFLPAFNSKSTLIRRLREEELEEKTANLAKRSHNDRPLTMASSDTPKSLKDFIPFLPFQPAGPKSTLRLKQKGKQAKTSLEQTPLKKKDSLSLEDFIPMLNFDLSYKRRPTSKWVQQ